MVCSSFVRSVIVQAGGRIGVLAQGSHQFNHIKKTLSVGFGFRTSVIGFRTSGIGFRTSGIGFRTSAKMMVDSSTAEKRVSIVDMPPEKVDDGGYIGGGWKK